MSYDINKLKFRPLHPEEIEIRVGTVSQSGASLLLYQDARCAMDILDETVGCGNWQRIHREIKGNMYCAIGIWDENKKQWIWKWDCGVESNTEKEKGESSDAYKRSAVNWGIGRELYSAGHIFVKCPTKKKENGRGYELDDRYYFSDAKVSVIELNEFGDIERLIIVDGNGKELFKRPKEKHSSPKGNKPQPQKDYTPYDMITAENADDMKKKLMDMNFDTKAFLDYVNKKMNRNIESVDSMTKDEYVFGMQVLEAMAKKGNQNE